jgi:hypothetical protein
VIVVINALTSFDYRYNDPRSFVVLIPGLSLLVQTERLAKLLPLPKPDIAQAYFNRKGAITDEWKNYAIKVEKIETLCKWHSRGACFQMVLSMIAVNSFAIPLFSLLGMIATCELGLILMTVLQNNVMVIDNYGKNGSHKITIRMPSLL